MPFRREPAFRSFLGTSLVLVAALVPGVWLRGEVLSQAHLLYRFAPWHTYAPPAATARNDFLTDPALVFYPFLTYAVRAVQEWRFPLWSAGGYAGHPFFASFQTALLSPFTAIAHVVPLPYATVPMALLPLVVGGLGMFLFVRSIGLGQLAAWFAGTAFLLNGFSVVWIEHPLTAVACWTPWLLWAIDRVLARPSAESIMLVALPAALTLLSGHPETAMKVWLLAGAYGIVSARAARRPFRAWATLAGGLGAGVLLATVQLVPFLEYLGQSEALARRSTFGPNPLFLPFETVITALVPDFFGNPADGQYLVRYNRFGLPANYGEQQVHAGVTVLVVAAVGLLCRWREWRVRFLAALAAAALALMYGFPGVPSVVSVVPGLNVAILTRFGFLVIVAAILLAAYGIETLVGDDADVLPRGARDRTRWAVAVVAVAAVAALAVAYLGLYQRLQSAGLAAASGRACLVALGLVAASAAVVALRARRRLSAGWSGVALCVLAAGELTAAGRHFHPTVPAGRVYPMVPEIDAVRRDRGLFRVYGWGEALEPNTALAYGLQDPRGWDGIGPARLNRLLDLGYLRQSRTLERHPGTARLLDLLNVKYAFVSPDIRLPAPRYKPVPVPQSVIPNPRFPISSPQPPVLYENTQVLPRAFLVDRYLVQSDTEQRRALHAGLVDLGRVALLEWDLPGDGRPELALSPASLGTAVVRHYRDEYVEVHTEAPGPRLLVLSDAHYPGWIATLDGRPLAIHRANYALRAVPVPSGRHVVAFEYRPGSVRLGAAVSLATLVVLLTPVLWSRRRDRAAGTR